MTAGILVLQPHTTTMPTTWFSAVHILFTVYILQMASTVLGNGNDCSKWQWPFTKGKCCTTYLLFSLTNTWCVCGVSVNGGYTEWSDWESCSASCGKGIKVRRRLCSNPEPAYGGLSCDHLGAGQEVVQCFVANCPSECAATWLVIVEQFRYP